jgi:hypothetical protein
MHASQPPQCQHDAPWSNLQPALLNALGIGQRSSTRVSNFPPSFCPHARSVFHVPRSLRARRTMSQVSQGAQCALCAMQSRRRVSHHHHVPGALWLALVPFVQQRCGGQLVGVPAVPLLQQATQLRQQRRRHASGQRPSRRAVRAQHQRERTQRRIVRPSRLCRRRRVVSGQVTPWTISVNHRPAPAESHETTAGESLCARAGRQRIRVHNAAWHGPPNVELISERRGACF